jgi:CheY-like chemotaxis protein
MEVNCNNCNTRFNIPDEKVPKGKAFALACPKCKEKIVVNAQENAAPAAGGAKKNNLVEEVSAGQYNASDRPFDFVEEGTLTALLCEPDPQIRGLLRKATERLGFVTTDASSARDALKQMRFHTFSIIVLNELFETDNPENNHVLKYLGRQDISSRRQMFVALLTTKHRTMDNMAAFTKSVNVVINIKNLNEIEKILHAAISEHNTFYKVFVDSLKKLDRI